MIRTESSIQQECYMWFVNNYCLPAHEPQRCQMFSVPNEMAMALRSVLIGLGLSKKLVDEAVSIMLKKVKNTGFIAGVSDTIICMPGPVTLFIEFKTPTGNQSQDQIDFMNRITSIGHHYYLCRSLNEFKQIISQHTTTK